MESNLTKRLRIEKEIMGKSLPKGVAIRHLKENLM